MRAESSFGILIPLLCPILRFSASFSTGTNVASSNIVRTARSCSAEGIPSRLDLIHSSVFSIVRGSRAVGTPDNDYLLPSERQQSYVYLTAKLINRCAIPNDRHQTG